MSPVSSPIRTPVSASAGPTNPPNPTSAVREELQRLGKDVKDLSEEQRSTTINDIRTGLSRLSDTFNDASHKLPAYDQREYASVLLSIHI